MFTSVLSLLPRARVSPPWGKPIKGLVVILSLMTLSATVTFALAQGPPSIGIVSPAPDSAVIGPEITVEVEVTDFRLVPPTGTDANPGEGHIIYFLDAEPVFIPGQPAIPSDPDAIYAASDQLRHTFEDVAPGPHEVFVLLVLDNHVSVLPPAIDQVTFTVLAPAETPEPQPPLAVTETARTIDIGEEASTPMATPWATPAVLASTPSPTPAVLAAQVPAAGAAPQESGSGLGLWLLIAIGVGIVAATGGIAVVIRRAGKSR